MLPRKIVIGILPTAASAETAVNNLTEEGFSEKDISLVMKNDQTARAILKDNGPLEGISTDNLESVLTKVGVEEAVVNQYQEALDNNKALLAVAAMPEMVSTIEETMNDYQVETMVVV
ncbi:general stress protein [Patescibacteria group bacterium]|nr:general stress protein [Patescibacteria group bacterium]